MGMTHGNKDTYPRLADVLGFCTPDRAVDVAEKVMLIQRDNGDRENRKHARLKYTIEDMTQPVFLAELAKRTGQALEPARPFKFTDNADRYGWTEGENVCVCCCCRTINSIYVVAGPVDLWRVC